MRRAYFVEKVVNLGVEGQFVELLNEIVGEGVHHELFNVRHQVVEHLLGVCQALLPALFQLLIHLLLQPPAPLLVF